MPAGRPTDYTEELANSFCSELALGNSLRSVCARDEFPSHQSIYTWLNKYPQFLEQYTRAKSDSGDADADRIEEIAEKVLDGSLDPQAARVAIDAYKWTAGKKRPKKYGDKLHTEHSGEVNLNSLTEHAIDEELMSLVKASQSSE